VERGLLGLLGLVLFAAVAMSRAAKMVLIQLRRGEQAQLGVVVFLGAMVATIVESLTHQTFHFRELWLILGVQEAMLFQMATATRKAEPTTHPLTAPPTRTSGLVAHRAVVDGARFVPSHD
jgi:hypothetical protein